MNICQLYLMSLFDLAELYIIVKKLFNDKSIFNLKTIFFIVITAIFTCMTNLLNYEYLKIVLTYALIYFFMLFVYKRNSLDTVYAVILSNAILILIQLVTLLPIKILFKELSFTFFLGIMSHIIVIIMVFIIYRFIPIDTFMSFVKSKNKAFAMIIANIFIFFILIVLYWRIDFNSFIANLIYISCFLIVIIFINIIIFMNGLKNEKEQQQLEIYQKYLPVIDKLISDLRSKQHDFDNHIQSIKSILYLNNDLKDVDEIEKYISDIKVDNFLGDLIKLDNKVLAGLLYNKKTIALEKNINFDIEINNYIIYSEIKDFEIVEIVGILLDNAIEAEERMNNPYVKIIIDKNQGMNAITVVNKHPYLDFNSIFKKGYTSKLKNTNNPRGFGLYNVKKITNKYDGNIEVSNQKYNGENYVVFRILIK